MHENNINTKNGTQSYDKLVHLAVADIRDILSLPPSQDGGPALPANLTVWSGKKKTRQWSLTSKLTQNTGVHSKGHLFKSDMAVNLV